MARNLVTNDFRAHRVCRFALTETGAGYASREQSEIIKTTHAAFRPIDAKIGPDGALYIADWYNPIIQHGEVDFRDARRDHTHGRIWRVTYKGRPFVERPQIAGTSVDQLLAFLHAPEDFTRLHAKLQLKSRGTIVIPKLVDWVKSLDTSDADHKHLLLEALWTYQALDVVEPQLLTQLLRAKDYHARAAATRVLAHWHSRIPQAANLLAVQVEDEHPQVRLEAIRALSELRTAQATELAMRALDHPLDRNIDHALWLAARELQPYWLPALKAGDSSFSGNVKHLTYLLQSAGSPAVLGPLMDLLKSGKLPADRQEGVLLLVAALGGPDELRVILEMSLDVKSPANVRSDLLAGLARATRMRKVQPAGDLQQIAPLLDAKDEPLRIAAIEAAGLWQLTSAGDRLNQLAAAAETSDAVRAAALESLAALGPQSSGALLKLCQTGQPQQHRAMAIAALAALDVKAASKEAVRLLQGEPAPADPAPMIVAILDRKSGSEAFAEALNGQKLPADAAKLAVRAVRTAAREEAALVTSLNEAGGISTGARALSPAELNELVSEVLSNGNAERGEAIFRRGEQACFKCHSIAGAGGRVGPDLASIGASAQVDYLIESILQPSAKIKENYHSLTVVADGRITSGVKVRETEKELVLRDVEDREVAVSIDSIEEKKEGGSLMPVGMADTLTRGELVDLVRFLSELGKVGPYATSKARVVRRWQALLPSPAALAVLSVAGSTIPGDNQRGLSWTNIYSQVSGSLPLSNIPAVDTQRSATRSRVVRFQLDVDTAGKVDLLLSGPIEKIWLDAKPVEAGSRATLDVAVGLRTVTLLLGANSDDDLRAELVDLADSVALVQIVGGK